MFKRFQQLNISLAAKLQLLFGAAVLMIIGAALFVPWQRMEQLMHQLNEQPARALADWVEAEHVAKTTVKRVPKAMTRPSSQTQPPASQPARIEKATVRMVLIGREPADLNRFEQKALEEFRQDPGADPIYRIQRYREGPASFRYARPLYLQDQCFACHAQAGARPPSASSPRHSTRKLPLLGMVSVEIPTRIDTREAVLNRIFIFFAGLLAGTLAIVVFYLITTRLILAPVRVLRETAEKVSEGDLNIRSHISTGDEFQKLSETFNRMLSHLQESANQLRAINKSLDLKLGQLSEANLALYESNRLKSEFLANVSHELRTPLNSILGFADLLRDSPLAGDAKCQRYVQNIVNSGKHLLGLITDLLDLAKIEAGRMEVHSEPLSLSDLLEGLMNIIKPLATKKELALTVTVARDIPILETDPGKLQQILYNFLSNAIKFSPTGGRVDLKAERVGEEGVRIAVSDEGPGIEAEKQAIIFEKFRQIDASVTREHGGTGLGLAISKELTALLGGSIGVQSKAGEGATFWIVLPVKAEAGVGVGQDR